MKQEIEELKQLVKELDDLEQTIGFEIGSLPRRMRDISNSIIVKFEATPMKARNRMRLIIRILATAGILLEQVTYGIIGAGGGIIFGLVMSAIWVTREKDPK